MTVYSFTGLVTGWDEILRMNCNTKDVEKASPTTPLAQSWGLAVRLGQTI